MKIQRFWGYPRLCLCLIYIFCSLSCAVRKGPAEAAQVKYDPPKRYELEAEMAPEYQDMLIAAPCYRIENIGNAQVFKYRMQDSLQLRQVKEALLSTGMVLGMKITIQ